MQHIKQHVQARIQRVQISDDRNGSPHRLVFYEDVYIHVDHSLSCRYVHAFFTIEVHEGAYSDSSYRRKVSLLSFSLHNNFKVSFLLFWKDATLIIRFQYVIKENFEQTILIYIYIFSKAFKQWKKIKHGRLIAVPGPLKRHQPPQ